MLLSLWYTCFGLLVDKHWLCRERAVYGMVRLIQERTIRGRVDASGHGCINRISFDSLVYLITIMYLLKYVMR
jgi:hypothetical protein